MKKKSKSIIKFESNILNIEDPYHSLLHVKVGTDERPANEEDLTMVQKQLDSFLESKYPNMPLATWVTPHTINFSLIKFPKQKKTRKKPTVEIKHALDRMEI